MIRATTRVRIKRCTEYDVYGNEYKIKYKVQYEKKFLGIPYWVYAKEWVRGYMESYIRVIEFSDLTLAEKYVADERKKVGESKTCQIIKEI
jgi:hypothetical protein